MKRSDLGSVLSGLSQNEDAIWAAQSALQEKLIELRDNRFLIHSAKDGMVCRDADGRASDMIRITTEQAVQMILGAVADHVGFETRDAIRRVAGDKTVAEVAVNEIRTTLIEFRDSRISFFNKGNGFAIVEENGQPSPHIRIWTPDAVRMTLEAVSKHLRAESTSA